MVHGSHPRAVRGADEGDGQTVVARVQARQLEGEAPLDEGARQRVRLVASGNLTITTLAGTGSQGSSGDGAAATSGLLAGPRGVAASAAGAYFIADAGNSRIRKVE